MMNQSQENPPPKEVNNEINTDRATLNQNKLKNLRTYAAINAGIVTGIFGYDGLGGLWLYIGVFFLVSFCLMVKMEFKMSTYFVNPNEVLYGGITNDLLIFLMLWVIIHNIVNIL